MVNVRRLVEVNLFRGQSSGRLRRVAVTAALL
jgi:hypothetical protein